MNCSGRNPPSISTRSRLLDRAGSLLVLTLLSCGPEPTAAPPNIVLFLLDTVRGDAVELDDAGPAITPNLRRLAQEGVAFTAAFTHTTWTKPAVATLFTSRFPSQHTVRDVAFEEAGKLVSQRLPRELETLAERLRAGGYRTVAIIRQKYLQRKFGFGQGFDEYYVSRWRNDRKLNEVLKQWVERRPDEGEGPFFLYMHYLGPHWPYSQRVDALRQELGSVRMRPKPPRSGHLVESWLSQGLSKDSLRALRARYLHGVADTDRSMGRALTLLEQAGMLDETVVLVTSDHGEGMNEHGKLLHGFAPYEEVHRVPLVVRLPKRLRTDVREVSALVGLVDIMPTLLDLAGLPAGEGDMGRSLVPLIEGESHGRQQPIFSETEGIRSLRTSGHKLIRHPDGRQEFFDLAADPLEQSPLPCEEICHDLGEELTDLVTLLAQSGAAEESSVELDEDDLERLRALGYLND